MDPVNDFAVVYLDSIDQHLLGYFDQDDGVHGSLLPSQGNRGRAPYVAPFISIGAGHQALERSLETVSSARVAAAPIRLGTQNRS